MTATSRPGPAVPDGVADLLDPATLLHSRCGRRIAEHPSGSIHLGCPFPSLPDREFRLHTPIEEVRYDPAEGVVGIYLDGVVREQVLVRAGLLEAHLRSVVVAELRRLGYTVEEPTPQTPEVPRA